MDLARKKLGLLLSTGPQHPNLETALGLATAALGRGASVYLYLIDDGVTALAEPRVRALPGAGGQALRVRLRLPEARIPLEDTSDITYCGLVVLDRPHQRHRPLHRPQLTSLASP